MKNLSLSKQAFRDLLEYFNFIPRDYQEEICEKFRQCLNNIEDPNIKLFSSMWNRKSGKDVKDYTFLVILASLFPGEYYYFFPLRGQAKDNIFSGLRDGQTWLDFIPEELVENINNKDLEVKFKNKSVIRFRGTDDKQSVSRRGFKPNGVVISEAAYHSDRILSVIFPAVRSTNGFIFMNSTPDGRDWYWRNHQKWMLNTDFKEIQYCKTLTVNDTNSLTDEQLEFERQLCIETYGDDLQFRREYYCEVEAGAAGAIYHKEIVLMEKQKRYSKFNYDSNYPVITFYDIGRDGTAIWFLQVIGTDHIFIDYEEIINDSVEGYVKVLKQKDYDYVEHYLPWDVYKKTAGSESSIKALFQEACERNKIGGTFHKTEKCDRKNDLIMAVKSKFRKAYFNSDNCSVGVLRLERYKRSFDERHKIYKDPIHDECSHAADALAVWAVNFYRLKRYENEGVVSIESPFMIDRRPKKNKNNLYEINDWSIF